MSSRRVLVGCAAERAPSPTLLLRPSHGSARARTLMQSHTAVVAPYSAGRISCSWDTPSSPSPTRTLHTSSASLSRDRRHPRPFHLIPPAPPSIHPHSSTSPAEASVPLPEQFRSLMRLLTHSVVVCTSAHTPASPSSSSSSSSLSPSPSPGQQQPTPRAMTMSSFTSLSLAPCPIVSFNIAVPSRTYDAVAASRHFNIHVLADDERGARVADWLAGGNVAGQEVFERLVQEGICEVVHEEGEAPVLKGDGVLYVLRCRLLDDEPARGLVRVRDHVIVLGEVLEIIEGWGAERGREDRFGLLYVDRRYRQLGNCIMPGNKDGRIEGR
ncbi:hypothetical protein VTI74DRAFT_5994 [Chaetomium olivicolor]